MKYEVKKKYRGQWNLVPAHNQTILRLHTYPKIKNSEVQIHDMYMYFNIFGVRMTKLYSTTG